MGAAGMPEGTWCGVYGTRPHMRDNSNNNNKPVGTQEDNWAEKYKPNAVEDGPTGAG